MARIITFNQLRLHRIIIDINDQTMRVEYSITDDTGVYRRRGSATFYRAMPEDETGTPLPLTEDEFVLTPAQASGIVAMVGSIRSQIQARFVD